MPEIEEIKNLDVVHNYEILVEERREEGNIVLKEI